MKKIISLLLVIALVFTLGGCFGEETEKVTPEDVKNRVISGATQYLKETYPDDEFTYISGRSPNWAYNYYEIGFSSKNYDNQLVTVFVDTEEEKTTEDGSTKYEYIDNYYQYYMKEDAEEYFYKLANSYLGENIVIKVSLLTNIAAAKKVDRDKNFAENVENDFIHSSVYILGLNNYDKEKNNINDFLNCLIENNLDIRLIYMQIGDFNDIVNKDIDTINEDKDYLERKSFIILNDGTIEEF